MLFFMTRLSGGITAVYGLIVLVGGLFGHYKVGSRASLIAGLVCGILLLALSVGSWLGKRSATLLALILTFCLDAFFTYRFSHSLKFMPSGMMSLISLITLLLLAFQLKKQVQGRL